MNHCIFTYKIANSNYKKGIRKSRFCPQINGYPKLSKPQVYMHTCHEPRCSNSNHIIVGTKTDNLLDSDISWTGTKEKYPCGHPRTKENTTNAGRNRVWGKCTICQRVKVMERYYKNHEKEKKKRMDWYYRNKRGR